MSIRQLKQQLAGRHLLVTLTMLTVAAGLLWWQWPASDSSVKLNSDTKPPAKSETSKPSSPQFNKALYSLNDPSSLWVVVNKGRILPSDYTPGDLKLPAVKNHYGNASNDSHLHLEAATALERMFAAASVDGLKLVLYSGYRPYQEQVSIYNSFVKSYGQAETDKQSARPGHSEHQTGWAVDIAAASGKCNLEACFGDMNEGKWLAANAHKYGFIIRYLKGGEDLTGYSFEPWHFRYVGPELAEQINKTGQTLEQFFGLPTYLSYPTNIYQLKAGQ